MAEQENEVEILHPDRDIEVGGETVTVREFTFVQGLQLAQSVAPLIADMAELFAGEDEPGFAEVGQVFAKHDDALFELIAVSTGKPRSWVQGLSDADGQALMSLMWVVNRDFFTRRLVSASLEKLHDQRKTVPPASAQHSAH